MTTRKVLKTFSFAQKGLPRFRHLPTSRQNSKLTADRPRPKQGGNYRGFDQAGKYSQSTTEVTVYAPKLIAVRLNAKAGVISA